MRITDVNIPKDLISNGLECIKMRKLGHTVILTGKNGAGKTRVLNTIKRIIMNKPTIANLRKFNNNLNQLTNKIDDLNKQLLSLGTSSNDDKKQKEIRLENQIIFNEKEIERIKNNLNWNFITTDKCAEIYKIVEFVPKTLDLIDSSKYNLRELPRQARSVEIIGTQNLPTGSFAKIQHIQNLYFNATHPETKIPLTKKEEILADYQRLKKIIKVILGTNIERTDEGEATIFNFPLGKSKLSEGQKILIQFCIALYEQKTSLNELILFMDEPENHLHPSVIIEIIKRIKKITPNGQIWIATHSISIIASFDISSIWYIDKSKINFAGKIPELVLNSLLGDEENIGKISDLLNLPAQFAINRYAYEALFSPTAITTSRDDPQILQINSTIKKYLAHQECIKILDYGAGKCRLLKNILSDIQIIESISSKLNYIAFDTCSSYKDECIEIIKEIYKSDYTDRYFNEISTLKSYHDDNSFDIILLCNVLHEIDPKHWLKIFGSAGIITSLLNRSGILMIVEDQHIPIGEKAYQKGFIVLDTSEIKKLFSIKHTNSGFSVHDANGDGRLKKHIIPWSFIKNVTADTRRVALNELKEHAKEQISKLRTIDCSYKTGQMHAFWTQQFANASLALDEL